MACSSNLIGTGNVHQLCRCHDNSFAAGPVVIKTEISSFCLNQGSSTPANQMVRAKTIWKTMSVLRRTLSDTLKGYKMRIFSSFFFTERDLSQGSYLAKNRCHLVSIVMQISLAKFEEHCLPERFFIQYFTFLVANLMTSSLPIFS